jgi:hypothetical protein
MRGFYFFYFVTFGRARAILETGTLVSRLARTAHPAV